MDNDTDGLAPWQAVWRHGLAPQFTEAGLRGLLAALDNYDPRLITGATMDPPPLQHLHVRKVRSCCPICYAALDGKQPYEMTVGDLDEQFFAACRQADVLMGEPGAVGYFLTAVDGWTRRQLRDNLLPEVRRALVGRTVAASA